MKCLFVVFLAAVAACLPAQNKTHRDYPAASPFDMVRWKGEVPEVRVGEAWYGLVAIDKAQIGALLAFSKRRCGADWAKRFCEDLVYLLSEMGHPPGTTVDLVVKDLVSGDRKTLKAVAMTRDKRQAIRRAEPRPRVGTARTVRMLSADGVASDVGQLERAISDTFSYATLTGFDYASAFGALREETRDGMTIPELHVRLRKIVAKFGDGHARVRGVYSRILGRSPECVFAPFGKKVAALTPSSRESLSAEHPIVVAIDGRPVEQYLRSVAAIEADGSPQLVHRMATRNLAFLSFAAESQGWKIGDTVELTLLSLDGRRRTKKIVRTGPRPFSYRRRSRRSEVLEGNVGYLPIEQMSTGPRFLRGLHDAMKRLAGTKGLVIDVRDNGGGSRHALRTLFPYFMRKDDPPHVANIGRYRLKPTDEPDAKEGYLRNRFLYPETSSEWNDEDRKAITAAKRRFQPRWVPGEGEFSDLHYMMLRPTTEGGVFHYDKPVVILIDSGCFSATDIFVGAFQGWRNVTLMGTPTGGGSGRSESIVLKNSGLEVKLSTMVSYRPDGRMYDRVGIAPDVLVHPTIDDVLGKTDSVLEKARTRLAR